MRKLWKICLALILCMGILPDAALAQSSGYTVTFDANNGTGITEAVAGISGEYTLPWITTKSFTAPAGTEFKGWEVNGVMYAESGVIDVAADTTVKAVWVIPAEIQFQSTKLYASKAVGYQLDEKIARYWKNGDSGSFTGTPDDYNMKIEWGMRGGRDFATITLKGANTADTDNTNYGLMVVAGNTFDLDIVVEEDSVMDQLTLYGCDVRISGPGKLTIVDPKTNAQNIYADGNLTITGANIYAESLEKTAANVIYATGDMVIDDSSIEIKSGSDWGNQYNFAPLRANGAMTIQNGSDVSVICIDGSTCHAIMSLEDLTIEDSAVTVENNGTNRGISSEKNIYIRQTNGAASVRVTSNGIAIAARSGKLSISGGHVTAKPSTTYAALRADAIEISGGVVTAEASQTYAIQAEAGSVGISGDAEVTASSETSAAVYAVDSVDISGAADVTAASSSHTGIIAEDNIDISGTVDVKASGKWALWSKAGNIRVSGGTVTASGSTYAIVSKPDLTDYANAAVYAGISADAAEIIEDPDGTAYHGLKYVRIQPGQEAVIPPAALPPVLPETGDDSGLFFWALLTAVCGAALAWRKRRVNGM